MEARRHRLEMIVDAGGDQAQVWGDRGGAVAQIARVRLEIETSLAEADLFLAPPVGEFGMFNMRVLDRLVEIGYEYTRKRLEEWEG